MTSAIVLYIYAYTAIELILDLGAVYFAVKLARITGAFRGWLLMIAAVSLVTLQTSSSIVTLILFYPESQLQALIDSIGSSAVIQGSIFGIGVSVTLFLAMMELFRTFRRLQARQGPAG